MSTKDAWRALGEKAQKADPEDGEEMRALNEGYWRLKWPEDTHALLFTNKRLAGELPNLPQSLDKVTAEIERCGYWSFESSFYCRPGVLEASHGARACIWANPEKWVRREAPTEALARFAALCFAHAERGIQGLE